MQHPFEQNFINGKWCRPATLFETSLRDFLKNEKLAANVTLYTDEKTFLNRVRGLAANFDDTDKRSMDRMEWITHAMKNMCL